MKRKIRHDANRLLSLKKRLNKYQQSKRVHKMVGRMIIHSVQGNNQS